MIGLDVATSIVNRLTNGAYTSTWRLLNQEESTLVFVQLLVSIPFGSAQNIDEAARGEFWSLYCVCARSKSFLIWAGTQVGDGSQHVVIT